MSSFKGAQERNVQQTRLLLNEMGSLSTVGIGGVAVFIEEVQAILPSARARQSQTAQRHHTSPHQPESAK